MTLFKFVNLFLLFKNKKTLIFTYNKNKAFKKQLKTMNKIPYS